MEHTDNRQVVTSVSQYAAALNSTDGKDLHWVTDINAELPIKMKPEGAGARPPTTVPRMFLNQVKKSGNKQALFVKRGGKTFQWTWNQYQSEAMNFAKALAYLSVNERSACAIMGFNSPEWVFGFMGGIMYNLVVTGIYTTNAPDACFYQADHSESEVILVENNDLLKRFDLSTLPRVKAIVVWGEAELPAACKGDKRVFLWRDFMKLGAGVKDDFILEKAFKQRPGHCCCLIYTSGTTGNPKACMLSHDNLCWEGESFEE